MSIKLATQEEIKYWKERGIELTTKKRSNKSLALRAYWKKKKKEIRERKKAEKLAKLKEMGYNSRQSKHYHDKVKPKLALEKEDKVVVGCPHAKPDYCESCIKDLKNLYEAGLIESSSVSDSRLKELFN